MTGREHPTHVASVAELAAVEARLLAAGVVGPENASIRRRTIRMAAPEPVNLERGERTE